MRVILSLNTPTKLEDEVKKLVCPTCEDYVDGEICTKKETYPVRGEPIEIDAEIVTCPECGNTIFNQDRDKLNLERSYQEYRRRHNLLTPHEIKEIREMYGISQRSLSRLLGWGDITANRYENGAVQDEAHNKLSLTIKNPQNMQLFLEKSSKELPGYMRRRVEARVQQLLEEEKEPEFMTSLERLMSHNFVDIYTGFKEFDLDKLISMYLYIASELQGVLKTKLVKMVWYADFLSFKEHLISISGSRYVHYQLGPVSENYELLLADMIHTRLFGVCEKEFPMSTGEEFSTIVEFDTKIFSKAEIYVLDFVINEFFHDTSTQIMEKTHEEIAYKDTNQDDLISYKYAEKLSVSLSE